MLNAARPRRLIRALCRFAKSKEMILTQVRVENEIQAALFNQARHNNSLDASGMSELLMLDLPPIAVRPPR